MDAKSNGVHTPGPWSVVEHSWSDTSVVSTSHTVCRMSIYDEATEDTEQELQARDSANARLIAAAPDLLSAAEHAEAWIGDMPHGDNCYLSDHYDGDPGNQCNCGKEVVLSLLNDAIAKATGGAP